MRTEKLVKAALVKFNLKCFIQKNQQIWAMRACVCHKTTNFSQEKKRDIKMMPSCETTSSFENQYWRSYHNFFTIVKLWCFDDNSPRIVLLISSKWLGNIMSFDLITARRGENSNVMNDSIEFDKVRNNNEDDEIHKQTTLPIFYEWGNKTNLDIFLWSIGR